MIPALPPLDAAAGAGAAGAEGPTAPGPVPGDFLGVLLRALGSGAEEVAELVSPETSDDVARDALADAAGLEVVPGAADDVAPEAVMRTADGVAELMSPEMSDDVAPKAANRTALAVASEPTPQSGTDIALRASEGSEAPQAEDEVPGVAAALVAPPGAARRPDAMRPLPPDPDDLDAELVRRVERVVARGDAANRTAVAVASEPTQQSWTHIAPRVSEGSEAPQAEDGVRSVEAALVVPPGAPRRPDATRSLPPDPDDLDAELVRRVERVVARMEAEFGHRVEIVEGYRTPERQRFLYAQGRTRPGPVVTWTRQSAHSEGRAVDVRIDGGYTDMRAYARLQRVAREEGLRTLGMRDPGHLELAPEWSRTEMAGRGVERGVRGTDGGGAGSTSLPARGAPGKPDAPARPDVPARVATPARVAAPAPVARPAAPVPVGAGGFPGGSPGGPSGGAAVPVAAKDSLDEHRPRTRASDGRGGDAFAAAPSVPATAAPAGGAAPATRVEPGASVAAVERALDAQAAGTRAAPTTRVAMRFDEGPVRELRVDLAGRGVEADVRLGEPAGLRQVRARVHELRRALETRGLDLTDLRAQVADAADPALPRAHERFVERAMEALATGRHDAGTEALRALLGGRSADGDARQGATGRGGGSWDAWDRRDAHQRGRQERKERHT